MKNQILNLIKVNPKEALNLYLNTQPDGVYYEAGIYETGIKRFLIIDDIEYLIDEQEIAEELILEEA